MRRADAEYPFCDALKAELRGICRVTDAECQLLASHFQTLVRWNQRMNLSGIRSPREIVLRHYCESLFLGSRLPESPMTVVDVGSGAGFPGVCIAAIRLEARVTLAESNRKKAAFLKESTRDFPNVRVSDCRAEELTSHFDWIVSRGVSWEALPLIGDHVALLATEPGPNFPWTERIRMPWGDRRVLLIGDVPRETSKLRS